MLRSAINDAELSACSAVNMKWEGQMRVKSSMVSMMAHHDVNHMNGPCRARRCDAHGQLRAHFGLW